MDRIEPIVDRACGLKREHCECEYPASDIGALGNYVSWVMELNLFDSIIIYRKDLGRCISTSSICRYRGKAGLMRKDCEINESGHNMGCEAMVFNSIKQRIRNLRGETNDC